MQTYYNARLRLEDHAARALELEAYTRSLLGSTKAVLVKPSRVPLADRVEENHAPNVSNKMCLR
jgi:hypothetical protein